MLWAPPHLGRLASGLVSRLGAQWRSLRRPAGLPIGSASGPSGPRQPGNNRPLQITDKGSPGACQRRCTDRLHTPAGPLVGRLELPKVASNVKSWRASLRDLHREAQELNPRLSAARLAANEITTRRYPGEEARKKLRLETKLEDGSPRLTTPGRNAIKQCYPNACLLASDDNKRI